MAAIYIKIKKYWKEFGTLKLLKKVILRICSFSFTYIPLNFYCISHSPETQVQPLCPLEIRKGSLEDIELIVNFIDDADQTLIRRQVKYFFDKGGEMFLAFSEGKLAHIARVCYYPGIIEMNPLEIHPPVKIKEDEVYIGFCQTSSEFRGKNIYPAVLQHIIKYVLANNIKRCFISTIPSNVASVRGIERAGFSFVSKKRKIRLFGKIFNNVWSSSDIIWP